MRPRIKQIEIFLVYWLHISTVSLNHIHIYTLKSLFFFFTGLLRETSPRHRKEILWIYGNSNAGRFYRSIRPTPVCKTVFRGCTFSYNRICPIKNATEEMNQRKILPINKTRILEAIANVIHSPHMNDKNSGILLNHGLHFITSTNFST